MFCGLFLFYDYCMKTHNDYVIRLECCGIAAHDALRLVCDFEREYPEKDLDTLIESIEKDIYVDKIQC